jgi:hypothetical protein
MAPSSTYIATGEEQAIEKKNMGIFDAWKDGGLCTRLSDAAHIDQRRQRRQIPATYVSWCIKKAPVMVPELIERY